MQLQEARNNPTVHAPDPGEISDDDLPEQIPDDLFDDFGPLHVVFFRNDDIGDRFERNQLMFARRINNTIRFTQETSDLHLANDDYGSSCGG